MSDLNIVFVDKIFLKFRNIWVLNSAIFVGVNYLKITIKIKNLIENLNPSINMSDF